MEASDLEKLITFGKALSDHSRLIIMRLCCQGEKNVSELVQMTGLAQSTVSHHLAILREAGFVRVRHHGKMSFYSLDQNKVSKCCQISEDVLTSTICDRD